MAEYKSYVIEFDKCNTDFGCDYDSDGKGRMDLDPNKTDDETKLFNIVFGTDSEITEFKYYPLGGNAETDGLERLKEEIQKKTMPSWVKSQWFFGNFIYLQNSTLKFKTKVTIDFNEAEKKSGKRYQVLVLKEVKIPGGKRKNKKSKRQQKNKKQRVKSRRYKR